MGVELETIWKVSAFGRSRMRLSRAPCNSIQRDQIFREIVLSRDFQLYDPDDWLEREDIGLCQSEVEMR